MGRCPVISKDKFFHSENTESVDGCPAAVRSPEGREFIVDTGASLHCIGVEMLTKEEKKTMRPLPEPLDLDTASGIVQATHVATVHVYELGIRVTALVMPDSPPLLSVGLLVKDLGMTFTLDQKGPVLTCENGVRI